MQQIPIEDTDAKNHINKLIEELEKLSGESAEDNNFIINKTKTVIDRFETEHPRVTAMLNNIMMTLSNMGI